MNQNRSCTVFYVQYYNVLVKDDIPKDSVDNALDCLRFQSERHGEDNEERVKEKSFALCSLYSVRGIVHIVRANVLAELLHGTVPYKAAV